MKRIPQGCFGYVKSERRYQIIKTVVFFAIPLTMFFAGWYSTGSRLNLLTVVAILGMLPASKSAVSMIMILRAKQCSKTIYDEIEKQKLSVPTIYDLNITTYKKTFQISSLCIRDKVICALTEDVKTDFNPFEKYMKEIMENNAYKGYTIKVFHQLDKYLERRASLDKLKNDDTDNASTAEEDKKIHSLLEFISGLSL